MKTSHKKEVKIWTQAELVKINLDFSFTERMSLPEVMAVWYWELDRELGTVIEPFVHKPIESSRYEAPLPLGLKHRKLGSLLPSIKRVHPVSVYLDS